MLTEDKTMNGQRVVNSLFENRSPKFLGGQNTKNPRVEEMEGSVGYMLFQHCGCLAGYFGYKSYILLYGNAFS